MAETSDDLAKRAQILELEKKIAVAEKEIAQARKDAAEAAKAAAQAGLPNYAAKPLAGSLTLDDKVQIESQTLFYQSLVRVATEIAKFLGNIKGAQRFILYSTDDVAAMTMVRSLTGQAALLQSGFESLLPGAKVGQEFVSAKLGATALTAILGSVADLAALFREDVAIKGVTIVPEHAVLISALVDELKGTRRLIHPAVLFPDIGSVEASALLSRLAALTEHRAAAEAWIAETELRWQKNAIDPNNPERQSENRRIIRLKALIASSDKLVAAISALDEKASQAGLARLIRAETLLRELEKEEGTYLLLLGIAAAGGSNKVVQRLWWSARLSHSGGTVVHCQIFDRKGELTHARVFSHLSGFVKLDDTSRSLPMSFSTGG